MPKPKLVRNLAHLSRDTGYRFTSIDPILEFIRGDITDSGWSLTYLSEKSGVSASTLAAWQNGRTKRPQNLTVEAVLRALGWTRTLSQTES